VALRTPQSLLSCMAQRPARGRDCQTSGRGRFNCSQALVFLVPASVLPHSCWAGVRLVYGAMRHSQWRTGQHDRAEARPRLGGPAWPGGVRSSIVHLLPLGSYLGDLDDSCALSDPAAQEMMGRWLLCTPPRKNCQWGENPSLVGDRTHSPAELVLCHRTPSNSRRRDL